MTKRKVTRTVTVTRHGHGVGILATYHGHGHGIFIYHQSPEENEEPIPSAWMAAAQTVNCL
jgi:hypothetical protein